MVSPKDYPLVLEVSLCLLALSYLGELLATWTIRAIDKWKGHR